MNLFALLLLAAMAASSVVDNQDHWKNHLEKKTTYLENQINALDRNHRNNWNLDIDGKLLKVSDSMREYVQEEVKLYIPQAGSGRKDVQQLKLLLARMEMKMYDYEKRIQKLEGEMKDMQEKTDSVIVKTGDALNGDKIQIGCGQQHKLINVSKVFNVTKTPDRTSGVTKFPVPTANSHFNNAAATRLLSVSYGEHQFYQTDLGNTSTTEYPLTSRNVDALTFDWGKRQIIWTNSSLDGLGYSTIHSVDVDGGAVNTLLSLDKLILSLAMDSARGLLFFTTNKPQKALHVLAERENYHEVVGLEQLMYPPKGLALHSHRKLIFVAHIDGIAEFDYQGRGQRDIIHGDWINTITVDESANAVYYSDGDQLHKWYLDSNTVQIWMAPNNVQTIVNHKDMIYVGYEHFPRLDKLKTKTGKLTAIGTTFKAHNIMCLIP